MTLAELMQPVALIFDWLSTRVFQLGEFPFTLMNWYVWEMAAALLIGFIILYFRGD